MSDPTATIDAVRDHWVARIAPDWAKPYLRMARMDRPIGWRLLLAPCWWSTALAAVAAGAAYPNPWHIVLFLIGAISMRGAGCVWNDIVDRDIDAKVERTRKRPIPAGQVTVLQAGAFMAGLCLIGLLVLLQFNWFAVAVGFASVVIVLIYPLMKRVTWWPQFVLGLAFNWGALMGWAATFGSLSWAPLALYAGGIAWTIGYDTIYAHQDIADDELIGVHSTARLFGDRTREMIAVFYAVATVFFGVAFFLAGAGWPAWLGLAAGAGHMVWQVVAFRYDDPARCLMLFRANRGYGWILFLGLVADAAFRAMGWA
ncbi:4-hydroxybenzoate octaprenyltransferase [Microbaculum marinisediminis]|uniref:4-hydroxybenzoate octaprenyltransferase n=1 Tax=Microbaculum marinisediminis TaxID=2931392 RepID=A0AAW5QUY5_9HYPH|nr:4-hydroxybenzoate octaprenyltransferase [Microbaculum sp. A6E488]MCT8970366.1 4-hydroxybenzoate octaprenyltransferase [Microbaculum sp. A6E488]